MTCYQNSEDDKNGNDDDENKQESKNPEDHERKVGPGTARNTEEPQGTPLMQSYVSNVFLTGIANEWAMSMIEDNSATQRVSSLAQVWIESSKYGEDKKDYEAIFRKYTSIGEDGEEHYDMTDMERDAQRAVRRIQDHQEIVKQYQKVVRAYNNFMKEYPWMTEALMQDSCWFGDMFKDEKRKSQFKDELGRLMGEYAVPLPLGNFSLNNKETRRLELWKTCRGMWFDHVEHMKDGQEQTKEWETFWWTVDEDMFTYVMKSKIEELIDEKLNQEFPEEVEIRENQDYDSEEDMTSETEETDDDESETNRILS